MIKERNDKTDELLDKFMELFREVYDELDLNYEYTPNNKETYSYNFDKNKLESSKQDMKDNPDKVMINKEGYKALLEEQERLRHQIFELTDRNNKLEEKNKSLIEAGKKVSDNGHKIVDSNSKLQHIINDKLYADGYKIMNDIKIYIEFARKCDAFKNGGFKDMINLIAKTVSDFITSQKEPMFC